MHHTSIIIHLGGFMASLAAELPPRHLVYTNQIRWKWCGFCGGKGDGHFPGVFLKTRMVFGSSKRYQKNAFSNDYTSPTKKKTAQPLGAKIKKHYYTKKMKKNEKRVNFVQKKITPILVSQKKQLPFPESWKCHEIGRTCEHEASRQVTTLAMFEEGWHRRCVDMILTIDIMLYMNIHNVDIQLYIAKRYIW